MEQTEMALKEPCVGQIVLVSIPLPDKTRLVRPGLIVEKLQRSTASTDLDLADFAYHINTHIDGPKGQPMIIGIKLVTRYPQGGKINPKWNDDLPYWQWRECDVNPYDAMSRLDLTPHLDFDPGKMH